MTERQILKLLKARGGKIIATDVPFDFLHGHDGDTFDGRMRGWSEPFQDWLIRLYGQDAPELRDKRPMVRAVAVKASAAFSQIVNVSDAFLPTVRKDKYFRLVCTIRTPATPDVGAAMEALSLTRPYFGEGPKPW